jgi:hypothetical protein
MPIITIIENEYMGLWFHKELKIVHHKMKQKLPKGAFEELLSAGADYLERYKASKWLSDDSEHGMLTPDENEWADRIWAPRVIKAGFKYWAVIPPYKGIAKVQMKRFIQEYLSRGITVRLFDNVDDAISWLSEIDG